MGKGEETRRTILDHAASLASQIGLTGLSIGRLADDLTLSKSGLFAHFRSKEALQVQVLEFAVERFVEAVVSPALKAPRGEPRLRALFERWRSWPKRSGMAGGCFFIAAAMELDDQPGLARDTLLQQQKDWLETICTVVRTGITEGHFAEETDDRQMAFELWGLMMTYHHSVRLLRDPEADQRAERAFERLLQNAHTPR